MDKANPAASQADQPLQANSTLQTIPRDPRQPADFDPVSLGRMLLRSARVAALGTLDAGTGFPVTTLVSIASDFDGAPIILVSGLSHHTKNLRSDPRCSLLFSMGGKENKGDPLAHPRLTLTAKAVVSNDPGLRERFLRRHPKAALYVDFPDFNFYRLEPRRMMLNGGFARAYDGEAAHILANMPEAAALSQQEAEILAEINAQQSERLATLALHACALPSGKWRAIGIDPHGLDLGLSDKVGRLAFASPVTSKITLLETLAKISADLDIARA